MLKFQFDVMHTLAIENSTTVVDMVLTPGGVSNQRPGITSVMFYKGLDNNETFRCSTELGASYAAAKMNFGPGQMKEWLISVTAPDNSSLEMFAVSPTEPTFAQAKLWADEAVIELIKVAKAKKVIMRRFNNKKVEMQIILSPNPIGVVRLINKK